MYKRFFKRPFDLIVALVVLLVTSPLFILAYIALRIQNNGSAFFYQDRPGLNTKIFRIIKFKTMNDKRDANGQLLPDVLRITTLGKWMRKLSIDELPQLINVLKGEMSLIGPRPLLPKYLPLYSEEQNRRHLMRPGITGWAQVNGRNSITWPKRFEMDTFYIDNCSFVLDMKILWLTVLKVIKMEGVNQTDSRPMEPFTGNN